MPTIDTEGVRVLGVRHHGPGSARAVRAELERLRPEAILIEGPPEADGLVHLAGELEPPVALLVHRTGRGAESVDDPGGWAFWPFASFSPEWVALRYAVDHGVEVRFCDLPAAHTIYGRNFARIRSLDQFADTVGALIQNQIRSL